MPIAGLCNLLGWLDTRRWVPHEQEASQAWCRLSLQWRHNEHDSFSNHQPRDCLLNRLFKRISKNTSKLSVTGLCEGNSPVTGEFPAQRATNTENVSIWWRHHVICALCRWVRWSAMLLLCAQIISRWHIMQWCRNITSQRSYQIRYYHLFYIWVIPPYWISIFPPPCTYAKRKNINTSEYMKGECRRH